MLIPPAILDTAHEVRADADRIAGRYEWGQTYAGQSLAGLCAVSSYELLKRLRKLGFEPQFAVGRFRTWNDKDGHAWVLWKGVAIDLTATQFGYFDSVHVEHEPGKDTLIAEFVGTAAVAHVTTEWAYGDWGYDWKKFFTDTDTQNDYFHFTKFTS